MEETQDPVRKARRVLVVDDDADTVVTVSHTLREAGYSPAMATDPQKALALARETPYAMVVTDLWMPGCDGIALARQLRALQPEMRVVIMTGRGDWDTYMEAVSDRVLDYVQKPVRRDDLLALVRKAFAPA